MKSVKIFIVLIIAMPFVLIEAHEPLFMMSHEAPGKGAFDVHGAVDKEGSAKEYQVSSEFSYGFTRDFAARIEIPVALLGEKSDFGLTDPVLGVKWRFWDRDSLGRKFAIAAALKANVPIGSNDGFVLGNKDFFLNPAISHGMESLYFYYFIDARYVYNVTNQSQPSDKLYLDIAPGWRPFVRRLEQVDVVFFFEFNYLHIYNGAATAQNGSQDIFYVAPDILISPTNRVMFRLGVQLPVFKRVANLGPSGANIRFRTEIRF